MRESVVGGTAWLAGGVVPALIGNDNAETSGGERADLLAPGIPEFGETVKEKDDGSLRRAGGDGVEIDCAVAKEKMLERCWHR